MAASIAFAVRAKESENDEDRKRSGRGQSDNDVGCGLWLAPSTIQGAGLGMFAGRDYTQGENLQEVGDIVIPIIDIEKHAKQYSDKEWKFLWDEYTWESDGGMRMDNEGVYTVNAASPGFGSAANSFLAIHNVDEWFPTNDYGGLVRSRDPGAGAFSPYYDRKSTAKHDIRMGQELFVSYGENWFETRSHFGPIPLFDHLDNADSLAKSFHKVASEAKVPKQAQKDLWDRFIRRSSFDDSRTLGAFRHDDDEELDRLSSRSLSEIRVEQSTRSLEWLIEHGTCGDHMTVKLSTLPQAGRGAFATRDLLSGTVVAHLPLIHIVDRGRLLMYNLEVDGGGAQIPKRELGVKSSQLLLNYCFGHEESSLVLCPYGPMTNFVNHNATRANVELRWADPARGNHNPSLLEGNLSALESDATAKLAFEFVATRDIKAGEEVFLDYGSQWDEAWARHVDEWKPEEEVFSFSTAFELNGDAFTKLFTIFDEMDEPRYPVNVELKCDSTFLDSEDKEWVEQKRSGRLAEYLAEKSSPLVACEIMRFETIGDEVHYTATMFLEDEEDDTKLVNHLLEGLPREAFVFVDRPYTSDLFLPRVFRHDIRIPDDMFPDAWRNLASS